jgi:hypothetical protein
VDFIFQQVWKIAINDLKSIGKIPSQFPSWSKSFRVNNDLIEARKRIRNESDERRVVVARI